MAAPNYALFRGDFHAIQTEFNSCTLQYLHEYMGKSCTQNNTINLERAWAVPLLCELHPGICHTTEEKARKNLSQGR